MILLKHFKLNTKTIDTLLKIAGTYGIVQVIAGDLRLKGNVNAKILQSFPVQLLLLYAAAFTFTNEHKLSALGLFIFLVLRYLYPNKNNLDS